MFFTWQTPFWNNFFKNYPRFFGKYLESIFFCKKISYWSKSRFVLEEFTRKIYWPFKKVLNQQKCRNMNWKNDHVHFLITGRSLKKFVKNFSNLNKKNACQITPVVRTPLSRPKLNNCPTERNLKLQSKIFILFLWKYV